MDNKMSHIKLPDTSNTLITDIRQGQRLDMSLLSALRAPALGALLCLSASSLYSTAAHAQNYSDDYQTMSNTELEIMSNQIFELAEKRKGVIKESEAELKRKLNRLRRLEQTVLRRYKALRMLQEELKSTLKRSKTEEEDQPQNSATTQERKQARVQEVRRLAKSFESMKPADAAQVIEVMDPDLVVDVLRMVKPRKSGKILGSLDPKTAARVSEMMTNVRKRKR
jgi:flagellar motility protein MotE (MotC chaperone)